MLDIEEKKHFGQVPLRLMMMKTAMQHVQGNDGNTFVQFMTHFVDLTVSLLCFLLIFLNLKCMVLISLSYETVYDINILILYICTFSYQKGRY